MNQLRGSADTSRAAASPKGDVRERQDFVIGGWTELREDRSRRGSILLGVFDRDALRYAGHALTGFDLPALESLYAELTALETRHCPYWVTPPIIEPVHWVRPELVAEVKVVEPISGGTVPQPVYLGLRMDKRPRDCVRVRERS
jgi:bifunctional non-homologous end joining protein LigD